jgi:putative PIN family toxin of toxin-antitoxin system
MICRAVYDTNVLVSALLKPGSLPSSLVSLAMTGVVQLCLSPATHAEYDEVIRRPRFAFSVEMVERFMEELTASALMVEPATRVTACSDDPDNRFLECALEASADYLVTGNLRHFPAPAFGGVRIVTPAVFAHALAEQGPS